MMQANAELTNNMIDLMQAGKCPHRQLAITQPQPSLGEMRQLEMAAFLMASGRGSSAPDEGFVARLRRQVLDECSKLERS
ncbi:MAG TPA: hypothetical protein VF914_19400 [Chloroflexia bacterium]